MKKKLVFLVLGIFIFGNFCNKSVRNNHNIVVIVIDALRSDHLPFYGYKVNTAPFLNKLSKESVVFEKTFAAAPWTSPATASIFTSLYPFQHKVFMVLLAFLQAKKINPEIKINRLSDEIETMPEFLKKYGYLTFGVADNVNIHKKEGFHQGFDILETYNYKQAEHTYKRVKALSKKYFKKKYFLYIHFMDTHAPYFRREPWYIDRGNDRYNITISSYDSEISYVDKYISKLYKELGWDKNTLLFITSDHGEQFWEHGKMGHGWSVYRQEIQVPLLIHFPDKKSKRIKVNVSTIDILPTIRDYLGIYLSKVYSGVSLLNIIKDENKYKNRVLFSHLYKILRTITEYRSIIYKNYQLVWKLPKKRSLYNIKFDKIEKNNIINQVEKRLVSFLINKFVNFYKTCKKYKGVESSYKLTKEKIKKLKSLGYVN